MCLNVDVCRCSCKKECAPRQLALLHVYPAASFGALLLRPDVIWNVGCLLFNTRPHHYIRLLFSIYSFVQFEQPSGRSSDVRVMNHNIRTIYLIQCNGVLVLKFWRFGKNDQSNAFVNMCEAGISIKPKRGHQCAYKQLIRHKVRHVSHYFDYLLSSLFRRRSNKTSKLRVTGRCEGNSLVTVEFPMWRTSNAESFPLEWRHHG